MKGFISVVFIFSFFISCKGQVAGYVNHDKWELLGTYEDMPMRSKPKQVKETLYVNLTDTGFTPRLSGKFNDYRIYKFDSTGNLIYSQVFIDSTYISDFSFKYDSNGVSYKSYMTGKIDTAGLNLKSEIVSEKLAAGKFQSKHYRGGRLIYIEVSNFSKNGDTITKESIRADTIFKKETDFYEDNRIKKIIENSDGFVSEYIFYYSINKYLDSVFIKINDRVIYREYYNSNEFGDVIYYEEFYLDKLKERRWAKYEYDEKGNWIKRITRSEEYINPMLSQQEKEQKFPGYRLLTREITY